MTQSNDLLTPEEAADELGVAPSTLVRWRRETRRRQEQIGPAWVELTKITIRYRRGAIDEYASSREQRADG